MKLEALKEQARRHEQREEWKKALDAYRLVIQEQKDDEEPDLALYNRLGDIQTRLKQIDGAVHSYQKAIDLYLEAELPNNAIAICKKVLRNLPDRSVFFLRMGQIRGSQGFLTDAKENFLTYAERMTAAGNLDAALDALAELTDLAPDDVEIRLGLADQLEAHGRASEAIEHYVEAYRRLVLLDDDEGADGVVWRIREMDPGVVLPDRDSIRGDREELGPGDLELGSAIPQAEPERSGELQFLVPPEKEVQRGRWTAEASEEEKSVEMPAPFDFNEEEVAEALPAFDPGDGVAEAASASGPVDREEEGEPLPLLEGSFRESSPAEKVEGSVEDAAFEAGLAEKEQDRRPGEVAGAPPTSHATAAEEGDLDLAMALVRAEIEATPDQLGLYQRQVEYAFRKGDSASLVPAYVDLARYLLRTGSATKAKAVFQQVLSLDPGNADAASGIRALGGEAVGGRPAEVASSEEYVDLGSMILGEDAEKTTRWQVTAHSPSGDDQADFAKMLSQFKEKVSEHVDDDDVSAHRDLGTAYLEMGLLDEAISEFQQALRTAPNHLPTHELMGRCWMEKGQPDMAVRALRRALMARFDVEDELIGIYYTMGRAQEELGNTSEAVEFYEKVFSLDINFQDVTERLRSLR